jgi:hypothetical protein
MKIVIPTSTWDAMPKPEQTRLAIFCVLLTQEMTPGKSNGRGRLRGTWQPVLVEGCSENGWIKMGTPGKILQEA